MVKPAATELSTMEPTAGVHPAATVEAAAAAMRSAATAVRSAGAMLGIGRLRLRDRGGNDQSRRDISRDPSAPPGTADDVIHRPLHPNPLTTRASLSMCDCGLGPSSNF